MPPVLASGYHPAMTIPQWHETDYYPTQVASLIEIAEEYAAPSYAALRSYATGRRSHALYGPFPEPVCRIANRRLWLRLDIIAWLTCPIPPFRRSRRVVQAWIDAGRPRAMIAVDEAQP